MLEWKCNIIADFNTTKESATRKKHGTNTTCQVMREGDFYCLLSNYILNKLNVTFSTYVLVYCITHEKN